MLERAIASVQAQTVDAEIVVQRDEGFTGRFRVGGAAETRNKALERVRTPWVAFLDDDDAFHPQHLEKCLACAEEQNADLVFPWFDGANSTGVLYAPTDENVEGDPAGPRASPEGMTFGPVQAATLARPETTWNWIPITVLAGTELVRDVGGFPMPGTEEWPPINCEDHGLWVKLLRAGAKFAHLPERTWVWHVHGNHLSG
jgi:hypothetical protein